MFFIGSDKLVSHTSDSFDMILGASQLITKRSYMYIDSSRFPREIRSPYEGKKLISCKYSLRIGSQNTKQLEFFQGKL